MGRRTPLSGIGLHSGHILVTLLDKTLLLEPSICVFCLVPVNCFAVIDPGTSSSLINSTAASVFPSDCCNKDNNFKRPRKVISNWWSFSVVTASFLGTSRESTNVTPWSD